ncbi:Ureide permease 5 [Capsicum annuum]|nr:Ureide permease 5 [Capsicum annuum]KAF3668146.1 Ureide permease 5 [Capsicum annuum]
MRGAATRSGGLCAKSGGLDLRGVPIVTNEDFWSILNLITISPEVEKLLSSGLKMYSVESKGGAIVCMLVSLFFLGTWPALLTLLERRGRFPQHTYLDYTLTNLLAAFIIAFTFGEIGTSSTGKPNFLRQLSQDNWPSVLFAMAGGVVLSIGNLTTQYAWAFVGLSVTEVVSSSITVVIGSAVHASNSADNKAKLDGYSNDSKDGIRTNNITNSKQAYTKRVGVNDEKGVASIEKAKFGTALFLIDLEKRRAIKIFGKSAVIGLALTFFAGVCFSLFSPAFNLATNDQWHTLKDGVPHLSVYTAFFYFSVSCFVVALILNLIFLYRPVLNAPKSSLKAYLNDWNGRGWALLAGLLCGFGNGLQFMGGQAAGYAAADAVQDNWPSVLFAMAGGVVLSLGNLATQYALAFVGLSVTEVVSASITVVIGSGVHASNAADNKAKLESYSNESKDDIRYIDHILPSFFSIPIAAGVGVEILGRSSIVGLALTFFAGACFSLFSPAFNLATNDQGWALLAGLLCGFGNGLQFMGGQAAGCAAADAVQALPLVSTFWGIVLFGEYRISSRKTYTLLVGMLSMFVAAVGVLMASAGQRK